jgi:hypothetical protein
MDRRKVTGRRANDLDIASLVEHYEQIIIDVHHRYLLTALGIVVGLGLPLTLAIFFPDTVHESKFEHGVLIARPISFTAIFVGSIAGTVLPYVAFDTLHKRLGNWAFMFGYMGITSIAGWLLLMKKYGNPSESYGILLSGIAVGTITVAFAHFGSKDQDDVQFPAKFVQ